MNAIISHDEDDLLENADGEPRGVSGPSLGCVDCKLDVETQWGGTPWRSSVDCPECGNELGWEA